MREAGYQKCPLTHSSFFTSLVAAAAAAATAAHIVLHMPLMTLDTKRVQTFRFAYYIGGCADVQPHSAATATHFLIENMLNENAEQQLM
jgi:hypothetical protein